MCTSGTSSQVKHEVHSGSLYAVLVWYDVTLTSASRTVAFWTHFFTKPLAERTQGAHG